jgi:hypothetical protein
MTRPPFSASLALVLVLFGMATPYAYAQNVGPNPAQDLRKPAPTPPDTVSAVVSWGEGVRVGAWIQPVFVFEGRGWEEDRQGFLLRRARLDVTGALIPGQIHFRLMPDLAQNPELRDAWVEFRGSRGRLRLGQQIIPFNLQREWSMAYAHFGERALPSRMFELAGGRDLGVTGAVGGLDGRFRLEMGLFNGQGANRRDLGRSPLLSGRATTAFGGPSPGRESGRASGRASGRGSGPRQSDMPVLTLGVGGMLADQSGLRPRPGFSADRLVDWRSATADAHVVWGGVTLLGAIFRQHTLREGGTSEDGDGFFLSAGWAPPHLPIEGVVRFGDAIWDRDRDPERDAEVAVGLSWFQAGHASQFRIQFARERLRAGSPDERLIHRLTVEHQLLLGG